MRRGAIKTRSTNTSASGADGREARTNNSNYSQSRSASKRRINKQNNKITNRRVSGRPNNDEEAETETSAGIVSEQDSLSDSSFAINDPSSNSQSDSVSDKFNHDKTIPPKLTRKGIRTSKKSDKTKAMSSSSVTGKYYKYVYPNSC